MQAIEGSPPNEPNVFPDGAASLPKTLCWSTASVGIFYPGRTANFTSSEESIRACRIRNGVDGEAYAAVSGRNAASTRAELAAMLGAAQAPFPVHAGMDNIAVVNRTSKMLLGQPVHPFKPWQLLADGHLWKLLADTIALRGASSFAATWVKGHAKDIHIQKKITTEWNRAGNKHADDIAEQGQQRSHPAGLRKLGYLYCGRQARYVDLIKHIHQVIIQTHLEASKLRANMEKVKHHPALGKKLVKWHLIPKALVWATSDDSTNLSIGPAPLVCPTINGNDTLYKEVWNFIDQLSAKHTSKDQPGVTWVELAALFVTRGGSLDFRAKGATASVVNTTLPQALHAFKHTVKLIARDASNSTLVKYLGPNTSAVRRLEPLGYDNHTPSISCLPVTTTREAEGIAKFMLNLRCSMKRATVERLEKGDLWLPKTKLTIKGVPNWKRFLGSTGALHKQINQQVDDAMASRSTGDDALPTHIHIACPTCGHIKKTTPSKLVQAARWKYTWCAGACQKNSTSSKWLCICKKPWHSCELHARCQPEPPRQPKPVRRIGAPNAHKSVPLTCPSTSTNPYTKHRKSHEPTLPPSGPTPPQPLPPPPEASPGFNLATPQPATTTKTELVKVKVKPALKPPTGNLRSRFAFGRVTKDSARAATEKGGKERVEAALSSKTELAKVPMPNEAAAPFNVMEDDKNADSVGPGPAPALVSSPEVFSSSLPRPARPGPLGSSPSWGPLVPPSEPRPSQSSVIHCDIAPVHVLTPSTAIKRKMQDTVQRKRPRVQPSPTAVYPAIFARSQVLAQRFSSLVGDLPH